MDDQELERMDICHAKYFALLEKKTFLAPIGDHPQRILDLGCGTGVCHSISFHLHPHCQHVGRPLMLMQAFGPWKSPMSILAPRYRIPVG
jgi:hypothetical protein